MRAAGRAAPIAGLAVLATVLLAACGHSSSQRPAVAHYIQRVNRIESRLAQPLAVVTRAGAQFAAHPGAAAGKLGGVLILSQQQPLLSAIAQISTVRRELASIPAPAPALHLRVLLLKLIDQQAMMTHEVTQLIGFLPRYQKALAPLPPAMTRLEAALSQNSAYGSAAVAAVFAAKVAALRRFQAQVNQVAGQLRRLHPPAVSKPSFSAQLVSLEGMAASAGRLANALAAGDRSGLGPLLTQFDRAAVSNQTASVQRAEIAAVRAYDARIAGVTQLSQSVEAERQRLANTLR